MATRLQEVQELDNMEKLVERMEQISEKLDIHDEIERKMNKLEDTKTILTNFISRQLGIENPEEIEFQWVH